jgi:hypothetical protein
MRYLSLTSSVLAVLVLPPSPVAPSREPTGSTTSKPLVSLSGRFSKIKDERLLLITSEKEWKRLWIEHKTGDPNNWPPGDALEVDFARAVLLAVFQGEGVFYCGYRVDSVREEHERITVRVHPSTFQVGPGNTAFGSSAWGVFVLARADKALVVERGEKLEVNSPHKWTHWKMFPAIRPSRED